MAGPGNDNITGDRYTLDLGVEPDLGNLLQNLTVANQLLDEAENKFKAISTVVGSTTQRVNELTRATQLFVTQTQRIRNEYQGIADASSRIGDLSAGAQGAGMGLIGAGMSPSVTNQLIAQSMMSSAARGVPSEPGQIEENPPVMLRRPPQKQNNFSFFKANFLSRVFEDVVWGKEGTPTTAPRTGFPQPDEIGAMVNPASAAPTNRLGTLAAGALGRVAPFLQDIGLGPLGNKALGLAGSLMSNPLAGPLAAAYLAKKVVDVGYNFAADTARQAQWYTQLTGGTSVAQSGYTALQGLRGEELRASGIGGGTLGGIASLLGYSNPLFNRDQAKEAMGLALGAGYQANGQQRKDVFEFLRTTTIKGYGDMANNLDLYQEAVDKAGGSTVALTNAINRLKTVATTSNVSIQNLAANFKQQIEELTGFGFGGTNAAALAAITTTAYQNAATPQVRKSTGPDLASPFVRAGLANYLGVSYTEVGGALFGGVVNINGQQVSATTATLKYSDAKVAEVLRGLGITPGMTPQEIASKSYIAGKVLSSLGLMTGIDPNDTMQVVDFIMRYTGGVGQPTYLTPMATEQQKALDKVKATSLMTNNTSPASGPGMPPSTVAGLNTNPLKAAGLDFNYNNGYINLKDIDTFKYATGSGQTAQASYIEQWYEAQLNNKKLGGSWMGIGQGAMNMPIVNSILTGMSEKEQRDTYVNLNGKKVNLANALRGVSKTPLTTADQDLLYKGLMGTADVSYATKNEEGRLVDWSALSSIGSAAEPKQMDGQTQATPLFVKVVPNGQVKVEQGKITDFSIG